MNMSKIVMAGSFNDFVGSLAFLYHFIGKWWCCRGAKVEGNRQRMRSYLP